MKWAPALAALAVVAAVVIALGFSWKTDGDSDIVDVDPVGESQGSVTAPGRWQGPIADPDHKQESFPEQGALPEARDVDPNHFDSLGEIQSAAEFEAQRSKFLAPLELADEPLEMRLDLFLEEIRDAHPSLGDRGIVALRGTWCDVFFRSKLVQEELAAMPPEARQDALAHVRREMGYLEDEIARLEQEDARREADWQVGYQYMEERERLVNSYEGWELEEELDRLRCELFNPSRARLLAGEERRGFFRYERPRVYGSN
jgi:hypothetical protein